METPRKNEPLEGIENRFIYLKAMLLSSGRFPTIADSAVEFLTRIRTVIAKINTEREAIIMAMAMRNYADRIVDNHVRALGRMVLNLVDGNRQASSYQRMFGTHSFNEVARMPFAKEIVEIRRIIDVLNEPAFESIKNQSLEQLTTAMNNLETAMGRLVAAQQAQAATRNELIAFRLDAVKQLRLIYGELLALMPDRKDEVESFFPRFNRRTSGKDEEETEQALPTPPA